MVGEVAIRLQQVGVQVETRRRTCDCLIIETASVVVAVVAVVVVDVISRIAFSRQRTDYGRRSFDVVNRDSRHGICGGATLASRRIAICVAVVVVVVVVFVGWCELWGLNCWYESRKRALIKR